MKLYWCGHGTAQHEMALDWLEEEIGERFRSATVAVVMKENGDLAAAWVWHNWQPDAGVIEFSGASTTPRWMTRAILQNLFAYAFETCGAQMIATRNSATNTRLHRQLKRYGFSRFDIPRLFGRDEDGVVWTLTDDAWRAGDFFKGDGIGQEI